MKKHNASSDDDTDNELDDHFQNDIQTIIEYSQHGSSRLVSKRKRNNIQHIYTTQLLNRLVALGWRPEYIIETFPHINDSLIRNWPDTLLIEGLFKEKHREYGFKNSIKESLEGIGLRNDVARKLQTILTPLLGTSYTDTQIIDIAIEYILGKYIPITSDTTVFLLYPAVINKWTTYSNYHVYNIPCQCTSSNTKRLLNHTLEIVPNINHSNNEYWFHATSWKSSLHIMEYIDHTVGRPCLDFGVKTGFYMTSEIDTCIEWCIKNKKRWSHETSIVIFSIPKILPSNIRRKILEGEEWMQVTKESRECAQQTMEIKKIRGYDLIDGNMVSNAHDIFHKIAEPITHVPPKRQIVAKSDVADRFLQECLIGCVYFQKYKP